MTGVLVDTCTSESSFGVIKVNKKITLKQMNEAIRQKGGGDVRRLGQVENRHSSNEYEKPPDSGKARH